MSLRLFVPMPINLKRSQAIELVFFPMYGTQVLLLIFEIHFASNKEGF